MPSLSLAYHFLFIFVFKISPLWVLISVTNVSQYKFPCRDDSVSCVVGKTELNWGLTEEQLNVAITTRIVVLFVIVRKKFENIYPNGNNSYLRRLLKRSWFSGVISLFQWASKFHKQIMPPWNPIWFDDVMLGETPHSQGSAFLSPFPFYILSNCYFWRYMQMRLFVFLIKDLRWTSVNLFKSVDWKLLENLHVGLVSNIPMMSRFRYFSKTL